MNSFFPQAFFRRPLYRNYTNYSNKQSNSPNINNLSNATFENEKTSINSNKCSDNFSNFYNKNTNFDSSNSYNKNTNFDFLNFLPRSIGPLSFNPNGITDNKEPIFELFGIDIFMDDIIIVGILIFLYKQEVKDESLYLILIMLLFS